ncbi:unnamed protein product, partial [Gulo gulo]
GPGSGKEQDAAQRGVDLFPQPLRAGAHQQAQASPLLQELQATQVVLQHLHEPLLQDRMQPVAPQDLHRRPQLLLLGRHRSAGPGGRLECARPRGRNAGWGWEGR